MMTAYRTVIAALCGLALGLGACAAPAGREAAPYAGDEAACAALLHRHFAAVTIARAMPIARDDAIAEHQGRSADRAFCRVEGVIEDEIGFELWLPAHADWNQRLLTGGVGGQAGVYNFPTLMRGVRRGYAAASTDAGHKVSDTHWLLGGAHRAENYAGRANHLLAVKAKDIIRAYYGAPAEYAFFIGCSGGGRQALTEVQRYPDDYDGVIAGAPGVNTPEMSARRLWEMIQHTQFGALMTQRDWDLVAAAALAACDDLDGLADGQVEDPRRCRFDPQSLHCRDDAREGCLNSEQIAAVQRIFSPLHDETGRRIDDGLIYGVRVSADQAPEPFTPGPRYLAVVLFGEGVHRDPNWDARSFNIARDLPAVDHVINLHADNPAIDAFRARGGKLILYQGWMDPLVSAGPTIAYYQALEHRFGAEQVRDFTRLFMVPGMEHCRGGGVPDQFGGVGDDPPLPDPEHDMLSALEAWVLRGEAPARIVASRVEDGAVTRTRPLCAFPQQAQYSGAGDMDDAANFQCRTP